MSISCMVRTVDFFIFAFPQNAAKSCFPSRFNYVGDSVLGFKSHMGAGSITSNVKSDKTLVHVKGNVDGQSFDIATGLKKFGAMLGDNVEVGCNSVLNPGTVIGRFSNIYPVSRVRGYVPGGSIFKDKDNIVAKQ